MGNQVETIGGDKVEGALSDHRNALATALRDGSAWDVQAWMRYLEEINPNHMALGLERVFEVAQRLHLYSDLERNDPVVVTVAGTNGKGSTSALIASAMHKCGLSVGLFTSPHLLRFNERININGSDIDDALLCSCLYEVIRAQYPDADIAHAPVPSSSPWPEVVDVRGYADDGESADAADAADAESDLDADVDAAAEAEADIDVEEMDRPLRQEVVDLTYFEITCLAAMRAMLLKQCQLIVLEVGLGGRLDAVNAFPNDLSIITSIGLDHMKILGDNTAAIAREKAGIIKPQGEVILGKNIDDAARREIMQVVKRVGAHAVIEGIDFGVEVVPKLSDDLEAGAKADAESGAQAAAFGLNHLQQAYELRYFDNAMRYDFFLPYPRVPVSCAGIALHAIFGLLNFCRNGKNGLFDDLEQVAAALREVALPGRMQLVSTAPNIYLDVAHNVPAALHLRDSLLKAYKKAPAAASTAASTAALDAVTAANGNGGAGAVNGGKRRAVIGMLKDKDVAGVFEVLKESFESYYVATLHTPRGDSAEHLAEILATKTYGLVPVKSFATVREALAAARDEASEADEIIVLGSFVTVAEAQEALAAK